MKRTTILALGVALVGCRYPSAAQGPGSGAALCFGGPAEVVASGEIAPFGATVIDGALYWQAGARLRRLARGADKPVELAVLARGDAKTFDARQAFGASSTNDLFAVDLTTGKPSILVEGRTRMEDPIFFASIGHDSKYVYFGRDQGPWQDPALTGIFRVPRDGSAAEEKLASEPDGYTYFIIDNGFVYWRAFDPKTQAKAVVRRPLHRGAPIQPIAGGGAAPLHVQGDRIFFVLNGTIASAPVDGSAPATSHVSIGGVHVLDLLIEGSCAYWFNSSGAILGARIDGGAPQPIAQLAYEEGPSYERRRVLATDGRFLYWADAAKGRVMRSGRP